MMLKWNRAVCAAAQLLFPARQGLEIRMMMPRACAVSALKCKPAGKGR